MLETFVVKSLSDLHLVINCFEAIISSHIFSKDLDNHEFTYQENRSLKDEVLPALHTPQSLQEHPNTFKEAFCSFQLHL